MWKILRHQLHNAGQQPAAFDRSCLPARWAQCRRRADAPLLGPASALSLQAHPHTGSPEEGLKQNTERPRRGAGTALTQQEFQDGSSSRDRRWSPADGGPAAPIPTSRRHSHHHHNSNRRYSSAADSAAEDSGVERPSSQRGWRSQPGTRGAPAADREQGPSPQGLNGHNPSRSSNGHPRHDRRTRSGPQEGRPQRPGAGSLPGGPRGSGPPAAGPDTTMTAILAARDTRQLWEALVPGAPSDDNTSTGSRDSSSGSSGLGRPSASAGGVGACGPFSGDHLLPIHLAAAICRLPKLPDRGHSLGPRTEQQQQQHGRERQGPPSRQQVLRELLSEAIRPHRAYRLTARQLCNILWSVAKLGAGGGNGTTGGGGGGGGAVARELWQPVIEEALGTTSSLTGGPQAGVGNGGLATASAMTEDGVTEVNGVGGRERRGWSGRCKLDQATGRELSNFAWAAGQLGVEEEAVWDAVRRAATGWLRGAGRGAGGGLGGREREGRGGRQSSVAGEPTPADLANLCWAFGKAGRQPGEELGRLLVAAAASTMQAFDPESLAGLVWGLGRLAEDAQAPAGREGRSPSTPLHSAAHSSDATSRTSLRSMADTPASGWAIEQLPALLRTAEQRLLSWWGPPSSRLRGDPAPGGEAAAGPMAAAMDHRGLISITLGLAAARGVHAPTAPTVRALSQQLAVSFRRGLRPDDLAQALYALVRCGEAAGAAGAAAEVAAAGVGAAGVSRGQWQAQQSEEGAAGDRGRGEERDMERSGAASAVALACGGGGVRQSTAPGPQGLWLAGGGGWWGEGQRGVGAHVRRALDAAARPALHSLPSMSARALSALALAYAAAPPKPPAHTLAAATPQTPATLHTRTFDPAKSHPGTSTSTTVADASSITGSATATSPHQPPVPADASAHWVLLRGCMRTAARRMAALAEQRLEAVASPAQDHGAAREAQADSTGRAVTSAACNAGPQLEMRELVSVFWAVSRALEAEAAGGTAAAAGMAGAGGSAGAVAAWAAGAEAAAVAADFGEVEAAVALALPLCKLGELAILSSAYARAGCAPELLMPAMAAAVTAALHQPQPQQPPALPGGQRRRAARRTGSPVPSQPQEGDNEGGTTGGGTDGGGGGYGASGLQLPARPTTPSAQDVATLAWAFATMGLGPKAGDSARELWAALEHAVIAIMQQQQQQRGGHGAGPGDGRSRAAEGVGTGAGAEVVDVERGSGRPGGAVGFDARDVANLLWAFAKVEHYSETLMEAASALLLGSTSAGGAGPTPALKAPHTAAAGQGAQAEGMLQSMVPAEVAMSVAAYGSLHHFDTCLLRAVAARVARHVDEYQPHALAWTLSAFALLNSHQPQLLRAVTARTKQLLREQQQQQQQQHPSARPVLLPVDVVSLLWAFGVLQHVDMDCLNGLLGALPRDPQSLPATDLSRLGLAEVMLLGAMERTERLRTQKLPRQQQQQGLQQQQGGKGGELSGGRVAASDSATAVVTAGGGGGRQRRLLPAALRRAVDGTSRQRTSTVSRLQRDVWRVLQGMGLQPMLEVTYGIFTLDVLLEVHPRELAALAAAGDEGGEAERGGGGSGEAAGAGAGGKGELDGPQEGRGEQGRRRSRRQDTTGQVAGGASAGESQGRAGGALGGAVGAGGSVDSAAERVKVAVEVDGPPHFSSNVPTHALGPTVARDRCLADMGLRLLVVPWFEWQAMQTVAAKRSYLLRRLLAVAAPPQAPPGLGAVSRQQQQQRQQGEGGSSSGRAVAGGRSAVFPPMVVSKVVVRGGSAGGGGGGGGGKAGPRSGGGGRSGADGSAGGSVL